jgi:hypothetical protein
MSEATVGERPALVTFTHKPCGQLHVDLESVFVVSDERQLFDLTAKPSKVHETREKN